MALCVWISFAMSEAWPLAAAIALGALLDRASIRFVRVYVEEHGSTWGPYEAAKPSYMRYWARLAHVDWRFPAAVLWAGITLLACFFIFLAGNAAWDFATMATSG